MVTIAIKSMHALAHQLSATFNDLFARSSFGLDTVLRMPLAIFYGVLAFGVCRTLVMFIVEWPTLDIPFKGLHFASLLANTVFLFTLFSLTVLRSKPLRSLPSMRARLMAVLGTTLPLMLSVGPALELPPAVTVVSIITIGVGCGLAIYTAFWLGRSFSIAPQARALVVSGAYSIVRHPLYLCEEVAVLGVMLGHFSPMAVAIVAVHWAFQLRRIDYEEQILRGAFPEYAAYAAAVPRLIPRW
jgi:protein-S-isoprenylcysteine O-methyltransferase Ste14